MPDQQGRWVFDTVVISNFVLADSLGILKERYRSKGIIIGEVYGELLAGMERHPKLKVLETLFSEADFKLISLSKQEMAACRELMTTLGLGESSAITYAQYHDCIMVTDDRAARNQCAQLGVSVTGTVGILKASVLESGITLEVADDILDKMIQEGFYSPVTSIADIF